MEGKEIRFNRLCRYVIGGYIMDSIISEIANVGLTLLFVVIAAIVINYVKEKI